MTEPTSLDFWRDRNVMYRVFDDTGRLIYVGSSRNWPGRLRNHESASWWFSLVAKIRVQVFPSKDAAQAAECVAIQEEQPAFNVHHTGRRGRFSQVTPEDLRVCQRWVALKPGRAGLLPTDLRWQLSA